MTSFYAPQEPNTPEAPIPKPTEYLMTATLAQLRDALNRAGKLAKVEAAIKLVPEVSEWWYTAERVDRANPYLIIIANALGLDRVVLFQDIKENS